MTWIPENGAKRQKFADISSRHEAITVNGLRTRDG